MRRRYCERPPRGWYCVWAEGHLGECHEWMDWKIIFTRDWWMIFTAQLRPREIDRTGGDR
jgi:hypothetical protein